MKKYLVSIALFTVLSSASFAQTKTAEQRATKPTEMMEKNLSLSAEQKTAIYNATVEKIKAIDALKEAAGEGNKPDAEQLKAINKKYNDVVKATLTDEQKAKAKELKEQAAAAKAGAMQQN
ncbi:MAG TPA: hypothetical protein VF273_00120 [Pelobium sp.]